jgi:hypothetical protein
VLVDPLGLFNGKVVGNPQWQQTRQFVMID